MILQDKTVVVCGVGPGLGREVAVKHPGTRQIRGFRRERRPESRKRVEAIANEDLHRALDTLRADELDNGNLFTRMAAEGVRFDDCVSAAPWTLPSARMMLKASRTASSVALPPTSSKFAGSPPWSLMMSMVAMARPAPLTMHPMLPSSLT